MTNSTLRFAEDIMRTDSANTFHCIVPEPNWAHFDPVECPAPIQAWIEKNYPEVHVERTAGFRQNYCTRDDPDEEQEFECTDDLPQPIFYVGFNNPEQVESFARAFSTPPLDTPEAPSDFILVTVNFRDFVAQED